MRKTKTLFLILRIVCILMTSIIPINKSYANEIKAHEEEDIIMHHIKDSHSWHFATIGHDHIVWNLPVIIYSADRGVELFSSKHLQNENHESISYKGYYLDSHDKIRSEDNSRKFYDISITKNIAAMLLGVVLLLTMFLFAASKSKSSTNSAPKGVWNLMEGLILFVRDDIVIPNVGKNKYKKYMPYMLTVFFFIWITNLLGLLPGAANVTGNISIALVLASFTFLITTFSGNKSYWGHIFKTPGVPIWLLPIMIPVEILGLLTKPVSLMIRLFANITAGHIILLSIVNLIFILGTVYVGALSVPFGAFMFILKLLVSFLQAYIFTLLSAIYIGAAVVEDHHH